MKIIYLLFSKLGWGKTKIKRQMYSVYGIALFVPLMIVGIILLYSANKMLNEHYMELLEADNRRVKTLLTEITMQAYSIVDEVYFGSELQDILSVEYESTSDFVSQVNKYGMLDELIYNTQAIEGLYIYTDNPTTQNYKQYRCVTDEIAGEEWYREAMETRNPFWISIKEDAYTTDKSNLCLVRRVELRDSAYCAVIVIKISDTYLRSRLDTNSIFDAVSVGEEGIVYSTKRSLYGKEQPIDIDYEEPYFRFSGKAQVDDVAYFATVSTIHLYQTNTKMYICTMDSEGIESINRIMNTWAMLLLAAVIFPGLILTAFAEYFARRVELLREEMHKARLQEYNIISEFEGNDELNDAFEDLKFMVQDIKAKDAKMYEAELNEKELRNKQQLMEYKMLAHQINPHYLYNTLETIRMKALTSGNKDVANAIKILGKTLHYVLENNGTTLTTLDRELEHVKNYLTIQKMRFGERINYSIIISPELDVKECLILPLLLQPVVENAVVHGLEDINGIGVIEISISVIDKFLQISVKDSGKGIPEEELARINRMLDTPELQPQSSIALYNINQRIRLRYGEEYGLKLDSALGVGTKVILKFPSDLPKN